MPFSLRKLPNKDEYKVYNKNTKKVHSYHTTKDKAIKQIHLLNSLGGKLSVSNLHGLLKASYNPQDKVNNFEKNKNLSSKTSQVYFDPTTNKAVITHRGTKGVSDWLNNAVYAIGGKELYKYTPRYKEAERVQKRAEKQYGSENISTIGHSQGGLQAELLGNKSHEIITYNKATKPFHNIKNKNQYDIRTKNDIISNLNPFQNKSKNDVIIPSYSNNPLKEHSVDTLNRLNPDIEIGHGTLNCNCKVNNGLYSDEIDNILKKHGYNINGVLSKDKLPKHLKNGWYVINLQSSNEGDKKGSHWVCFKYINEGQTIEYFDAFGFPPPIEVMERSKDDILYSKKEIQDYNSTTCGWFCIGAIVSDKGYGSPESHFHKYIHMFSNNTKVNDKILSNFLTSKNIQ